jgi:hypothetical protein
MTGINQYDVDLSCLIFLLLYGEIRTTCPEHAHVADERGQGRREAPKRSLRLRRFARAARQLSTFQRLLMQATTLYSP